MRKKSKPKPLFSQEYSPKTEETEEPRAIVNKNLTEDQNICPEDSSETFNSSNWTEHDEKFQKDSISEASESFHGNEGEDQENNDMDDNLSLKSERLTFLKDSSRASLYNFFDHNYDKYDDIEFDDLKSEANDSVSTKYDETNDSDDFKSDKNSLNEFDPDELEEKLPFKLPEALSFDSLDDDLDGIKPEPIDPSELIQVQIANSVSVFPHFQLPQGPQTEYIPDDKDEDDGDGTKPFVSVCNGRKTYFCPQCPYNTWHTGNMQTHIMRHTGEKPITCPHCNYSTRQKGHMRTHMLKHTGEKPFREWITFKILSYENLFAFS